MSEPSKWLAMGAAFPYSPLTGDVGIAGKSPRWLLLFAARERLRRDTHRHQVSRLFFSLQDVGSFIGDAFLSGLEEFEKAGIIPEARKADVEAVRKLLGVKKR